MLPSYGQTAVRPYSVRQGPHPDMSIANQYNTFTMFPRCAQKSVIGREEHVGLPRFRTSDVQSIQSLKPASPYNYLNITSTLITPVLFSNDSSALPKIAPWDRSRHH